MKPKDILTIDDVDIEIRVPLIMRRKRKELDRKLAVMKLLTDDDLFFEHAANAAREVTR